MNMLECEWLNRNSAANIHNILRILRDWQTCTPNHCARETPQIKMWILTFFSVASQLLCEVPTVVPAPNQQFSRRQSNITCCNSACVMYTFTYRLLLWIRRTKKALGGPTCEGPGRKCRRADNAMQRSTPATDKVRITTTTLYAIQTTDSTLRNSRRETRTTPEGLHCRLPAY